MSDPRVAHCIFCDDIRQEVGNKLSIMGTYTGVMHIHDAPPRIIAKFGIVAWLIVDIDDTPKKLRWSIRLLPNPGEISFAEMQINEDTPIFQVEGAKKRSIQLALPMVGIHIPEDGTLEVWVETELGDLRAGLLKLRFDAPAT